MDTTKRLVEDDFIRVAEQLGCSVAAIKAVTEVESRGGGFDPEEFPKTLFEGHWFHKLTNGEFADSYPSLSYPKWTRQHYGKTWDQEKVRLQEACQLDREAALKSASWGMFQIMGFNHEACGFPDVQSFVNAMCESEGHQLEAFANFIVANNLAKYLINRDWAGFARRYNGPAFAENRYDVKLAAAYKKFGGQ